MWGSLRGRCTSLVAQLLKNPPAMQKTLVRFLCWKDPLEKGTSTHPSILALRIPMDRGVWQATVHGVAKSRTLSEPLSLSGRNWHIPPPPTPKSCSDQFLYLPSPLPVLCFWRLLQRDSV